MDHTITMSKRRICWCLTKNLVCIKRGMTLSTTRTMLFGYYKPWTKIWTRIKWTLLALFMSKQVLQRIMFCIGALILFILCSIIYISGIRCVGVYRLLFLPIIKTKLGKVHLLFIKLSMLVTSYIYLYVASMQAYNKSITLILFILCSIIYNQVRYVVFIACYSYQQSQTKSREVQFFLQCCPC